MYAIFDTSTNLITQGPWRELPARVRFTDGDTISPPHVGASFGAQVIVNVIDNDRPPTPYHSESNVTRVLSNTTLAISRSFALTGAPTPDHIKGEARRRILARYPEWKQSNMTARGLELAFVVASGGTLSAADITERDELMAAFAWVKSIRTLSDGLELSLPLDFAADAHWGA